MLCEYCGFRQATHFCSGCGKWVCNDLWCNTQAALHAANRLGSFISSEASSLIGRFLP